MPLADIRVVDLSTVIAGPNCARYLADYGADVIKVERPGGDSLRNMAWRDERDDEGLWWKLANRNKRTIVADLKDDDDRALVLALLDEAHVVVENFRPGTLERLGLGPDVLHERNARLVVTRVTGFGQDGPYASRPGFATIAEAMSGFAAINGEPDGQPLLPPIALTDEVTALAAAFATMVALHSGVGQVVDVNLLGDDVPPDGPVAVGVCPPRCAATAARRRPAVQRAAGDVPLPRRSLGRRVDEQRLGGRAGDAAPRSRRRRAVPLVRRSLGAPRGGRGGDGGVVRGRARPTRCWPPSRPPRRRPAR